MLKTKHKSLLGVLGAFALAIPLTGCNINTGGGNGGGNNSNNAPISVVSFGALQTSTTSDKGELKLKLSNYKNYQISGITINGETMIQDIPNESTSTFLLEVEDLKLGVNQFKLESLTYVANEETGETKQIDFTKEYTTKITRVNAAEDKAEIEIESIEIVKKNVSPDIYTGDKIQIRVKFHNPNNYKIIAVKINGVSYSTQTQNTVGEYSIFTSPNIIVGSTNQTYTVNAISYYESELSQKEWNYSSNNSANLEVTQRGLYPNSFDLSATKEQPNDLYDMGESTKAINVTDAVQFTISVTNEDLKTPKKIVLKIDGKQKALTKFEYNDNPLTPTIKFQLDFQGNATDTPTGKHHIELVGIVYDTTENGTDIIGSYTGNTSYDIDVYDLIIKNESDFFTINNKLTGRYLLGDDIKFTKTVSSLIGKFAGYFDGNGYKIDANSKTMTSPLFESIIEKAQVVNLQYTNFYFVSNKNINGMFVGENYGTINNISMSCAGVQNSNTDDNTISSLFAGINQETGSITNVFAKYGTNIGVKSNGTINLLFKENYGTVQHCINNLSKITPYNNGSELKLNLMGEINGRGGRLVNSYTYITSTNFTYELSNIKEFHYGCKTYDDDSMTSGLYFTDGILKTGGWYYHKVTSNAVTNKDEYVLVEGVTLDDTNVSTLKIDEISGSGKYQFHAGLGFNEGDVYWNFASGPQLLMKHANEK